MALARDTSYAIYDGFDSLSYECIKHLMDADEVIWKLLYYNTSDAWNRNNLTAAQKAGLIYDGSDDTSRFRVFMDQGQPDVDTTEQCQIRITPHSIFPDNKVIGSTSMLFEVFSHYKINHLSNYKTRTDMIAKRFVQVFNGVAIPGMVGKLFFDRLANESNRLEWGGQTPFKGRFIIMSSHST